MGISKDSIQEVPSLGKYPSIAAYTIAYAIAGFQASKVEKPRVPWLTRLPIPVVIR